MELLTKAEAAALLKVSPSSFDRAVKAHRAPQPIRPTHPGGRPRWVLTELELWLENLSQVKEQIA